MRRQAPPEISRALREIDQAFFIRWRECRSPDGVNHRPCRRDFDGQIICDKWVVYRKIDPSVDGLWIERYFGRNWKGPIPRAIRLFQVGPEVPLGLVVRVLRRGHYKSFDEQTIYNEILKMQQQRDASVRRKADRYFEQAREGFLRAAHEHGVKRLQYFVPSSYPDD